MRTMHQGHPESLSFSDEDLGICGTLFNKEYCFTSYCFASDCSNGEYSKLFSVEDYWSMDFAGE
jgi:hypothetical protein